MYDSVGVVVAYVEYQRLDKPFASEDDSRPVVALHDYLLRCASFHYIDVVDRFDLSSS